MSVKRETKEKRKKNQRETEKKQKRNTNGPGKE